MLILQISRTAAEQRPQTIAAQSCEKYISRFFFLFHAFPVRPPPSSPASQQNGCWSGVPPTTRPSPRPCWLLKRVFTSRWRPAKKKKNPQCDCNDLGSVIINKSVKSASWTHKSRRSRWPINPKKKKEKSAEILSRCPFSLAEAGSSPGLCDSHGFLQMSDLWVQRRWIKALDRFQPYWSHLPQLLTASGARGVGGGGGRIRPGGKRGGGDGGGEPGFNSYLSGWIAGINCPAEECKLELRENLSAATACVGVTQSNELT